jgi:dynein heavy chain
MLEKEIMPNPDFTQQRAKDVSDAMQYIFLWINAMYTYFKVFTET